MKKAPDEVSESGGLHPNLKFDLQALLAPLQEAKGSLLQTQLVAGLDECYQDGQVWVCLKLTCLFAES